MAKINEKDEFNKENWNNKINKNNIITVFGVLAMIALFLGSFAGTCYMMTKDEIVPVSSQGNVQKQNNENNPVKILYKTKFLKNDEHELDSISLDYTLEKSLEESKEILKMSEDTLVSSYGKMDYTLKGIENNEVVFMREVDGYKYKPNKYVLGIENNHVAILKTGENNTKYLENPEEDITEISIEILPKADVEYLKRGHEMYEFDTKKEALNFAIALFRS